MICFFQRSETLPTISFGASDKRIIINSIYKDNSPKLNEIYFASTTMLKNYYEYINSVEEYKNDINLFNVDLDKLDVRLPFILGDTTELGRTDLDLIESIKGLYKEKKETIKIMITTSVIKAIGDTICMVSLLSAIKKELAECNIPNEITLLTAPESSSFLANICGIVDKTLNYKTYPISILELQSFDFLLITNKMLKKESASKLDYYDLIGESINYKVNKKNLNNVEIYIAKNTKDYVKNLVNFDNKNKIIYFSRDSSTGLRTMSIEKSKELIEELLNNDYNVIICDRKNEIDIQHKNYFNFARYSTTLEDLIGFIEFSDGVITTDSAPLHIAGLLKKKTLAIFSSIHPELRTKYYKTIKSIFIGEEYENQHFADITYEEHQLLWNKVKKEDVMKWVKAEIKTNYLKKLLK